MKPSCLYSLSVYHHLFPYLPCLPLSPPLSLPTLPPQLGGVIIPHDGLCKIPGPAPVGRNIDYQEWDTLVS